MSSKSSKKEIGKARSSTQMDGFAVSQDSARVGLFE